MRLTELQSKDCSYCETEKADGYIKVKTSAKAPYIKVCICDACFDEYHGEGQD